MDLTPDEFGNVSVFPDLLDQIEGFVRSLTADGAQDSVTVCDAILQRLPTLT